MDRRKFFNWVGLGFIANFLLGEIAACSSGTSQTGTQKNFQTVGTVAQLDRDGQILNQQIADRPILVVRNPANPDILIAVNPTCTHRDCLVDWKAKRKVFACSCHDSEFDPSGKVLTPPATEPLTTYVAKIEGDRIQVG
jgi:cytochrome b6-f complex iron-sulfur subunit